MNKNKKDPRIICRKDNGFESKQLPKNWKYHKGTFNDRGQPQFRNMAEAKEAAARARGEEGVEIHYDEL
jgi:hypothetical protein